MVLAQSCRHIRYSSRSSRGDVNHSDEPPFYCITHVHTCSSEIQKYPEVHILASIIDKCFNFPFEEITCTEAPAVQNATIVTTGTQIGNVTEYVCSYGYVMRGQNNATCTMDTDRTSAFWSTRPNCTGIIQTL